MRKLSAVVLVAASACGVGNSFNGKVSGYPLEAKDAIFTVPVVNGKSVGAVLVLSDQPNACSFLAGSQLPGSTALAVFSLSQWANNVSLGVDVGEFPVVETMPTSDSGLAVQGQFIRTDVNGSQTLPANNAAMKSGMVKVNSLTPGEDGLMQGSFDLRFGSGDAVQGVYSAQHCNFELLKSGVLATSSLSTLVPIDLCTAQSKCSADPAATSQADCRSQLAGKCGDEARVYATCFFAKQTCGFDNKTDVVAIGEKCSAESIAYGTCLTK